MIQQQNSSVHTVARGIFGLALVLVVGSTAAAEPNCYPVLSRVELATSTEPGCTSEIGLCATGKLRGTVRGNSEFTGTSFLSTVETEASGVVVLTGDNLIHTAHGDLYTKDTIVLSTTGDGEFAELDVIVGGTGVFAGATGTLTGTGTFDGVQGEGLLIGEVCRP